MPIGERGPYSAISTSPATIVGSANGRSMTALSAVLPGNSSRTSTHAVTVPSTAFVSAAATEISSVSFSAETASADETVSQNPASPFPVDDQTSAAIGSATITDRKVVTKPRERAVPVALSLRWRNCGTATLARGWPPTPSSIFFIRPLFGSNHFLSAARQPPIVLSLIVNWPGRTGNCFLKSLNAAGLTGRKPNWPNTSCAGTDLTYWMKRFAASLFELFAITAIGSSISIVWRGITYWMFWPWSRALIASLS